MAGDGGSCGERDKSFWGNSRAEGRGSKDNGNDCHRRGGTITGWVWYRDIVGDLGRISGRFKNDAEDCINSSLVFDGANERAENGNINLPEVGGYGIVEDEGFDV